MASTVDDVANDVSRGQRVMVFSPLFFGDNLAAPNARSVASYAQMLTGIGQRPLGLEAAQITAVVRWLGENLDHGSATPHSGEADGIKAVPPAHVVTTGPRSETVALIAMALEPELFATLESRKSISSFGDIFEHPAVYSEAPEMMCLDLYRDFDINTLTLTASPVVIDLSSTAPQRIFWH
jgi:hypothetical protein